MLVTIRGKSSKGAKIIISAHMPLVLSPEDERYVKRLEAFAEKKKKNKNIMLNEEFDGISREKNAELFGVLMNKMQNSVFAKCPGSIYEALKAGENALAGISSEEQVSCLMSIISWFNGAQSCDLKCIGGSGKSGAKQPNSRLSGLKKKYQDIRIVDMSASGLFVSRSENLFNLL